MSDSVRPHRRQPTRLPRPWASPGKNTGVGCHFLLQCMKVKVKSLSRVRLSEPMDCSPPGSSVHILDFPGKSTGVRCHHLLHQEPCTHLQIGPCSTQEEGDGQESRIADSFQLTETEGTELHQASKKAWICMVSIDSCSITSSVDKEENRFWWTRRNL